MAVLPLWQEKTPGIRCLPWASDPGSQGRAAVIQAVVAHVLTPARVEELLAAANNRLEYDIADVDAKIERTHSELSEVEHAIANLVDLENSASRLPARAWSNARHRKKRWSMNSTACMRCASTNVSRHPRK